MNEPRRGSAGTDIALRKPRIAIIEGKVTTTSLVVAEHFEKNHKDVLRSIRTLECSEGFRERNFALTSVGVPQPNGGLRHEPAYRMTRDGFSILAMGFTGKAAVAWKEAYIDAFNAMEQALLRQAPTSQPGAGGDHFPDRMSPKQFLELYYALDRQLLSAAILWQLIQMGAHREPVRASIRDLIKELGSSLSLAGVHKAARRLEAAGLIDVARSQWVTKWFVLEQALRERLGEALKMIQEQPGLDIGEWAGLALPGREGLH